MANFTPKKIDTSTINSGQEYAVGDLVAPSAINSPIESGLYTEIIADGLTQAPDISQIAGVGTPTIEFVDGATVNGVKTKKFAFKNMLGGGSGIQPLRMRDSESGLYSAFDGTKAYDLIFDKTDFVVDRSTLYKVKVNTAKFVDAKWKGANATNVSQYPLAKFDKDSIYAIKQSDVWSSTTPPIFLVSWHSANFPTKIELTSSSSVSGNTFSTKSYYLTFDSSTSSETSGAVHLMCRTSNIVKGTDGAISFSETTAQLPYYYRKFCNDSGTNPD